MVILGDTVLVLVYSFVGALIWYAWADVAFSLGSGFSLKGRQRRRLPGPTSYPFIGSVVQVGLEARNTKSFQLFRKLCQKYGPVMEFKAGVQNFVVVEDYQTAKNVLTSEDWSARYPNHPVYREMTLNKNAGILFSRGESWKQGRRFAIRALIDCGFGEVQNMEAGLQEELDDFMTRFDRSVLESSGEICFHQYFNLPVLNILWRFMCGARISCNDQEMRRIVNIIEEASASSSIGAEAIQAFPFLRFIPGITNHSKVLRMFNGLQGIFRDMIRARREKGNFLTTQADFMDMFMKKIEECKRTGKSADIFTDDQLIQSCTDLVLAGSDTSANALEFAVLYMVKNPEVQRRVQKEIDTVIGRNRRPSIADRPNMPYTEACIMEVLRWANIIPIDMRASMSDTELNGCFVPKNTFILLNFTQIHMEPSIWGDPTVFRPSRFLDENGRVVKESKFLAFGAGKRKCIGFSLAKCSLFGFFTTILQKYDLEPSPKHPELSTESFISGFTNVPTQFYCSPKLRTGP